MVTCLIPSESNLYAGSDNKFIVENETSGPFY